MGAVASVAVGDVRASPDYRLEPLDALPEAARTSLVGLGVDLATVAGVLVARPGSGRPDKVVDRSAADLFAALVRPGRLPDAPAGRIAGLVLDGVLEVEGPAGFIGGPQAYEVLGPLVGARTGDDPLGRLAEAALAYAARLELADVDTLTARLYGYGRVPLSGQWSRMYAGPQAVLDLLPERTLAARWAASTIGAAPDWLVWTSTTWLARCELPYKLYVSPHPAELPDALGPIVEALTASGAPRFKIGASAFGLLRPDKVVVYLADASQTARVAAAVAGAVRGARPHGVPFSAALTSDGLLSWGGDPPAAAAPVGRRAESWRLSVCRRLAEQLVAAQRVGWQGARAADVALARLSLDEVDVASFAPSRLPAP